MFRGYLPEQYNRTVVSTEAERQRLINRQKATLAIAKERTGPGVAERGGLDRKQTGQQKQDSQQNSGRGTSLTGINKWCGHECRRIPGQKYMKVLCGGGQRQPAKVPSGIGRCKVAQ